MGHHDHRAPEDTVQDGVAICPVMPDNTVVKAEAEAAGLVRDHGGRRYWLCCSCCGPRFDADPERYTGAA
ncbi:hypothetical protein [Nocardiopsis ganjiahuensis]|uniref:hypothetical protein n=1 Tax=Nocardiopsis ganjiahuensis TaxID=239984 RepID=UPI00034DFCF5|nr:hypothetical protein [Nocardiopsis ganjiahuensis]